MLKLISVLLLLTGCATAPKLVVVKDVDKVGQDELRVCRHISKTELECIHIQRWLALMQELNGNNADL